jgi:DNA (cytosine-5)-methyltransferase 1
MIKRKQAKRDTTYSRKTVDAGVTAVLNGAYVAAEKVFGNEQEGIHDWNLSKRFQAALEEIHNASSSASTALTNVVTSLAIKAAFPELDVRYHQVQIGAPFSFRPISEKVVYPWLARNHFEGAKSGWQTRTFERPKPFTMDFEENIEGVKEAFLTIYDEVQQHEANAAEGLAYLLLRQMELREHKKVVLAEPTIDDINVIVKLLEKHFTYSYSSKGASRLPVLAMHAIYSVMIKQLMRFEGMTLLPLKSHSAADEQTGSVGDIEVSQPDGNIFEALEIKHNQKIEKEVIEDSVRKILGHQLDRYYILTTHQECRPSEEIKLQLREIKDRMGCQVITNGVLPTIQYYLRMLDSPAAVIPQYVALLREEVAISHQHREVWNDIVVGKVR